MFSQKQCHPQFGEWVVGRCTHYISKHGWISCAIIRIKGLSQQDIEKFAYFSTKQFMAQHSKRVVVRYKQNYKHKTLVNCILVLSQACPGKRVIR